MGSPDFFSFLKYFCVKVSTLSYLIDKILTYKKSFLKQDRDREPFIRDLRILIGVTILTETISTLGTFDVDDQIRLFH